MRTGIDYLGSAWIASARKAVAGEMATIQIIYQAGKYGIDDCGCLLIAWRGVSNMEVPQFDRPEESGYTTVETDSAAKLKLSYIKYKRPYHNAVKVEVIDGYLCEGEKIILTFGDKRQGSPGIRMQSFTEREFELLPLLDACGTERFIRIPTTITMQILPARANTFQVWCPGMVIDKQDFSIALRSLDVFGNITPVEPARVALRVWSRDGLCTMPKTVTFTENDGVVRIGGCRVHKPGVYYFIAENLRTGQIAVSSPCICKHDPKLKLFWGDMHGQTRETLGCGRLDDYLKFARDYAMIDVASWQGNDLEITDSDWLSVREQTALFHKEGKFLVFLGYEWSGTTNAGGDHNVYFYGDSKTFYPSSNWISRGEAKVEYNAFPLSELFDRMRGRSDIMVVPHIGGRRANLDFYNGTFLHNIEIHSLHGIFEWFALEAMRRRLRVGFLAASDDHTGRPGLGYPCTSEEKFSGYLTVRSGLTGIYAEDLTKRSIWNALTSRHCYASTLDRIYLETHLESHGMGDEFPTCPGVKTLQIEAAGSDVLDALYIYDWDTCIKRINLQPKLMDAIRIRISGVTQKNRNKTARWQGTISVKQGEICSVERCGYQFGLQQAKRIAETGDFSFRAITNGDIKGYILEMHMTNETEIQVDTNFGSLCCSIAELKRQGSVEEFLGGENLRIELDFANEKVESIEKRLDKAILSYAQCMDVSEGEHAYWVKLLQEDGNLAWASPIYMDVLAEAEK